MDIGKILLAIFGAIILIMAIIGGWFVSTYNGLVSVEQDVNTAWGNVETQYQRRADLIPNLVATVEGYASHEKTVLEEVTRARSQWAEAKTPKDKIDAAGGLDSAISRLLLVAENYPQLKASDGFRDFQVQLEGTENRIAVARTRYNEMARNYNVKIKSFFTSIVANMYGYQPKPYFEAKKGAEDAPKVNFTNV